MGSSDTHCLIGSRVAKDFGDSTIFFGYVTCYFPAQLDDETGEIDTELFHIEYDDGDEDDMDSAELGHAIRLAQELAGPRCRSRGGG